MPGLVPGIDVFEVSKGSRGWAGQARPPKTWILGAFLRDQLINSASNDDGANAGSGRSCADRNRSTRSGSGDSSADKHSNRPHRSGDGSAAGERTDGDK